MDMQFTELEILFNKVKEKKDQYLDSLITNQFLSSERKRINEKMDELELEEKQLKARISKIEFEFTEKSEEKINLTQLKKEIVTFKSDHESMNAKELKAFMNSFIKELVYFPDKLTVTFRLLPWPIDFST